MLETLTQTIGAAGKSFDVFVTPDGTRLPDRARIEDVSQVWAFRGARMAIDAVARTLLGAGLWAYHLIDAQVPGGSLGLWWLGQAGFVFETRAASSMRADVSVPRSRRFCSDSANVLWFSRNRVPCLP